MAKIRPMDVEFVVNRAPDDEQSMNLLNEALSSTRPPLMKSAVEKIERIEQERLEQLDGNDRYAAIEFFAALQTLPPVEGFELHDLISALRDADFDIDRWQEKWAESLAAREQPEPGIYDAGGADEYGFVYPKVALSEMTEADQDTPETEFLLSIDAQRSNREGDVVLEALITVLLSLENEQLRIDLIDDCGRIVKLRACIDIS